jgi:hypothetical protein
VQDARHEIAAPMVGGAFTSFLLELLVYPAIYELWRWHTAVKKAEYPLDKPICSSKRQHPSKYISQRSRRLYR